MVVYKVLISVEAKTNLQDIFDWLKEYESLNTANKVKNELLAAIEKLCNMPERYGLVQEIKNNDIKYRRILKWSYKIIFTIDENESIVYVVDIVHAKQNSQNLQDKYGSL